MNIFKMPVHAAAEIFPMLDDDELNELAEDIKANGLMHPLVVKDGVLIDGRNRREACKRAGVEPVTTELNGQDPATYILSANINRRHLSKSQRAMAVAMLFPEPEKGGRGRKNSVFSTDFSSGYVSHARTVLQWSPPIAAAVLAGLKPLNEAYAEAKMMKDRNEELPVRIQRLRASAPDLADLVEEGKLSINEAAAANDKRKADERNKRQGTWDFFGRLERDLALVEERLQIEETVRVVQDFPKECPTKKAPAEILDTWIEGLKKIRKGV